MKSALYITYDGLTDQLGGSQIIPYVKYLSAQGHKITIISCEKEKNFTPENRKSVTDDLTKSGIEWHSISYTKSPPILSGLYDRYKIKKLAKQLFKKNAFDLIHCRSYLPALVGMALKKAMRSQKNPPKLVFDMRGFWADEKVEVGSWPQANPLYKTVYNYFKKAEAKLIRASDHIVILTQAGADELISWPEYSHIKKKPPITVIPCCVDTEHFNLVSAKARRKAKVGMGFEADTPILGYLGAIGGWYMLPEMLTFFAEVKKSQPRSKLFFITRSDPQLILSRLSEYNLKPTDILIRPAQRHEVPGFLASMDLGLSFILPTYAKTASSPTKQAEYLACGIPIITNDKIGDNRLLIGPIPGCDILDDMDKETIEALAKTVTISPFKQDDERADKRAKKIRAQSIALFSLQIGGARYNKIYETL